MPISFTVTIQRPESHTSRQMLALLRKILDSYSYWFSAKVEIKK